MKNTMPESLPAPYAHNLVNTLYAMKGLLETCLDETPEDGKSLKSQTVLKRAYGQADQALKIAKRLGSILVLKEDGQAKDLRKKASVKQTWHQSLGLLQKTSARFFEGIEIIERIPEPFPPLQCDPKDLREIFYHLSKNALQAMKGKGKLIIRVQLSFSTKEEPLATIQAADTGPGIPVSELPHLFLPFYSTKSRREGNGLGLYLVRRLVTRNGGRIAVSSFKDAGTTFTIEFPLAS